MWPCDQIPTASFPGPLSTGKELGDFQYFLLTGQGDEATLLNVTKQRGGAPGPAKRGILRERAPLENP
jgi:hypothetical protein